MALYDGFPVVFYAGKLYTSATVEGAFEFVPELSPVVFTNAPRFWIVKAE